MAATATIFFLSLGQPQPSIRFQLAFEAAGVLGRFILQTILCH
jgi:hypothetical protein